MVKVNKESVTFKGVALSGLSIDELRLFESKVVSCIVKNNNELDTMRQYNLQTSIPFMENHIIYNEHKLAWIKAEINGRYAGMVV